MESRRVKRTRKAPSPNSVLDRRAFVKALEDRGLTVKPVHIDAFYQALHRQHYPDLSDFVNRYYEHEEEASDKVKSSVPVTPLKNKVSGKKNKNKVQLPLAFLEFIKDPQSSRRRAMIEYVMLEGDTSSLECAHQLGKLCENRHLVVNLIPYNQTDVKDKLRCPSAEHIEAFRGIVSSYGAFCTVRRTMGADIDSACGQLITLKEKESQVRDIEDTANPDSVLSRQESTKPSYLRATTVRHNIKKNMDTLNEGDFDCEPWVGRLALATSFAASCFVVSVCLLLKNRKK